MSSAINTNVQSMISVASYNKNQQALGTALTRLSTGFRINSGKDDPAGLIASNLLMSEQAGTTAALSNIQRADNIISTADGSLGEVSSLLTSLQGFVTTEASKAGLSQDEKDANQMQVDSILSTINRISSTSSFEGVKLLNGTFDYSTSSVDASFLNLKVNAAQLPTTGGTITVTSSVTTSARTGAVSFQVSSTGTAGCLSATTNTNLTITGNKGSVTIALVGGAAATQANVVASINAYKDNTGVSASTSGTFGVRMSSTGYGSNAFVTATFSDMTGLTSAGVGGTTNKLSDTYAVANGTATGGTAVKKTGRDATVSVNGTAVVANGLEVNANLGNIDVSYQVKNTSNATANKVAYITGGGANFMIGSKYSIATSASLGIGQIDTSTIGKVYNSAQSTSYTLKDLGTGGNAALNTANPDFQRAQDIITKAIKDVSTLRGRLGAFQSNVLQSTANSLQVSLENLASSNSAIRDTEFASETSNLTRSQILVQASTSVLSTSNNSPQSVLKLLG